MRHLVERFRFASAAVTLVTLIAGCGRINPADETATMTLLRAGSEKVCVADDVRQALRELIVPKSGELEDANVPVENRLKAISAIRLGFAATTLSSVDQTVTKATCNTTTTIGSANGDRKRSFRLDYSITPSAENPKTFVITAKVDDARAFAIDLVGDEIDDIAANSYNEQQERDLAQQKQQLLATVTEKWLTGAWIGAGVDSAACGNGQAIWFEPAHVLEGTLGKGRWSLTAEQLHLVGGQERSFDVIGPITRADPISFTVQFKDDESLSLRRCTRAETETLPQPDDNGSAAE